MRMLRYIRRRLFPRLADSRGSYHVGREPAVIYLGSGHEFDAVADYAHRNLPVLVPSPAAPGVVPVHLFDGAKHGLYDAPLMVLELESGGVGDVQVYHRTLRLAALGVVDGVGFGTDARHHALAVYDVADLPGQVGGIQAEITRAAAKPVQHGPQPVDVCHTAVRHDVIKHHSGAYVDYAVELDPSLPVFDAVRSHVVPPDEPIV